MDWLGFLPVILRSTPRPARCGVAPLRPVLVFLNHPFRERGKERGGGSGQVRGAPPPVLARI